MYKVEIIAKYIVNKCIREHHPITNLQLQKILYGLAEEYRKENSELFSEKFDYLPCGPVILSVFYHYFGYGVMPIDIPEEDVLIREEDKNVIDLIVEKKRAEKPWKI